MLIVMTGEATATIMAGGIRGITMNAIIHNHRLIIIIRNHKTTITRNRKPIIIINNRMIPALIKDWLAV
jgi:hypothetical protein